MGKGTILTFELLIFAIVQFLGLFVAKFLYETRPELTQLPQISLIQFVVVFIIATSVLLLALKYLKKNIGFKIFFMLLIFIGSNIIFNTFLPEVYALLAAAGIVLAWLFFKFIWMHNLAIILAIAGVSVQLGMSISVPTVIILITFLSIYDVIAVYGTRHMITLFKSLVDKGVILSIIVPGTIKGFFTKTSTVKPGHGILLLGTGDLAFPLIFAVSVLKYSLMSSVFVIGGALIGVVIVFNLLTSQTQRRALPALPPIAVFSILGFLISLLI